MKHAALLLLALLMVAPVESARAQIPNLRIFAGPVVPVSMSDGYNTGKSGGLSLSYGLYNGGFGVRADLWGTRFTTETINSDFWNVSILGSVLYAIEKKNTGPYPYVLLGLAGYRHLMDDGHDPYGWVLGAQTGVGISWPIQGIEVSAEVQYQVVFSDLVAGCDFCLASQMPVVFGIGF
ncbi:MAG TPA: hypothetical protein VKP65_14230 [Rhodothermales bacterium]|nr:hypothetical protein [Rhodothermales bacterium]